LSDANIKDVKEMLGHGDIAMTDRYSHLTAEHHKALQDRLVKHYEGHEANHNEAIHTKGF